MNKSVTFDSICGNEPVIHHHSDPNDTTPLNPSKADNRVIVCFRTKTHRAVVLNNNKNDGVCALSEFDCKVLPDEKNADFLVLIPKKLTERYGECITEDMLLNFSAPRIFSSKWKDKATTFIYVEFVLSDSEMRKFVTRVNRHLSSNPLPVIRDPTAEFIGRVVLISAKAHKIAWEGAEPKSTWDDLDPRRAHRAYNQNYDPIFPFQVFAPHELVEMEANAALDPKDPANESKKKAIERAKKIWPWIKKGNSEFVRDGLWFCNFYAWLYNKTHSDDRGEAVQKNKEEQE